MGHVVTEKWIKADLAKVFAFFSDPENLPRLMPAQMAVRLLRLDLKPATTDAIKKVAESGMGPERVAGPGSTIEVSFRFVPFLPFRGRWVAQIVEFEPLSYFVDTQRNGPMRHWTHRHSFRAESRDGISGTVVRDEVEYELPFGLLGRLADTVLVGTVMQRTFESRQNELQRILVCE